MSINNDVLSEVSFTSKTMSMWHGWLVNRPVVEWWICSDKLNTLKEEMKEEF